MNICIFVKATPAHSKGGLQDIVLMLSEGLVNAGNKVTVITTEHPEAKEMENIGGVTIYYLQGCKNIDYGRAWWRKSLEKFIELNEKDKFDIVHSQSVAAYSIIKSRKKLKLSIPIIVTMHGTCYDEIKTKINVGLSLRDFKENIYIIGGILKQLMHFIKIEYWANRNADMVIATSYEQIKIIKKLYNLEDKKISLIFNGIDTRYFYPKDNAKKNIELGTKYSINPDDNIILCMARLNKEKGIQDIIKALPEIINWISNTKLVIIGDGRYRKSLEKLATKSKVKNSVIFTGYINLNEIIDYLNFCDIFVNPTIRQNGYDLSILEAMACGVPVVATNLGSIPSVIKDNENGFLFQLKNIKELEKKILYILDKNNEKHITDIKKNAIKTVREYFMINKMIDTTIRVYEVLTKKIRK